MIPDNEAFVINREEPFMEAEPIRQEGKEQQYEALQQTDTFTPLEEKAEEDLQNQKNTSGRKNKKEDSQAVARETQNVADAVRIEEQKEHPVYHTPPISLLKKGRKAGGDSDAHLRATALKLEQTLRNFGVGVHVTNASCGPSVTRYELQPEQGVKVSKIVGLADDIKLNLAAADIRIEAPIRKAAVGIEVPNKENSTVMLGNHSSVQRI